ncbi:MAG TPA: Wzz/FepE/Etk N-terminal domain-containing protein, partial [Terriglobales bacterium]|nr:Wzz/FepE/Etk N-terminal domain-containing protein [Terriglobales bacterium]
MQTDIVRVNPPSESVMSLSLRGGAEAFFRQKQLFIVIGAAIVFAAIVLTVLMKRQYTSEMKFLVQNARGNVVVTPERTTGNGNLVSEVNETQVNSEIEILRSHDVMDGVADPEWQTIPPYKRDAALFKQHEARLASFDKRLITEPVRKTNVISVTLRASTAEEARDGLRKLSEAYLAQHRKMQRPVGASEFFASEAERYRKAWDDATQKFVDFQKKYQVNSLQQRETEVEDKITKAQTELLADNATLHELDAR